ncbi:MAG TPA: Gfo/Idh/MocA family oxidoreductase [Phycisphaerae bacterium]|nr:Gfo/Idh/MocA family oxidoreductase [Phycisphaerae bacterium]
MTGPSLTRRAFLQTSAAAAATGLCTSHIARAGVPSRGANERLRVGLIGAGDRGTFLLERFLDISRLHNAQLVAVCDLWSRRREQAVHMVQERTGKRPAPFRNTDELFSSGGLDAVIIATPDFAHAHQCVEAVQAGLDVYVETPLAHTLEEAELARRACLDFGRVVQMGTDNRSRAVQIAAAEYVRSGAFGSVREVEIGRHVHDPRHWRRDALVATLRESDTDWRRYQLNQPARPFDPRRYLEFRLFWPYSSGLPGQWLSHHIDTVAHVAGESCPIRCVASGSVGYWHDGRENVDAFTAWFEYASGLKVRYSARHANAAGGAFARFFSEQEMLDLHAGTISSLPSRSALNTKDTSEHLDVALRPLPRQTEACHLGNWLDCIRTRKSVRAGIEAGYAHSVAVAMAVRALHSGRSITYDPVSRRITEALTRT